MNVMVAVTVVPGTVQAPPEKVMLPGAMPRPGAPATPAVAAWPVSFVTAIVTGRFTRRLGHRDLEIVETRELHNCYDDSYEDRRNEGKLYGYRAVFPPWLDFAAFHSFPPRNVQPNVMESAAPAVWRARHS